MAPIRPTKSSKPSASSPAIPSSRPSLSGPSSTAHKSKKASDKKTKRASKHASLITRIQKTAPASKVAKRRRPSKKLVTTLDGLADALPETAGKETSKGDPVTEAAGNNGKIKHKSLKSRPGANKKKEKLVAMERERFALNMARMAGGSTEAKKDANEGGDATMDTDDKESGAGRTSCASADRWAAIRGFISQTMEKRQEGIIRR